MFKNLIFGLIISIMVILPNTVSTKEISKNKQPQFHFRKVKFGMKKDEVRHSEKEKHIHETDHALMYEDQILDIEVYLIYSFLEDDLNNGLWRASYSSKESYRNDNNHIRDYKKIKSALIEKYGTPISDKINWDNSLYKNDPSQHGFAISIGHVIYEASWTIEIQKEEIDVWIRMEGENSEIRLSLSYTSNLLEKIYRKQARKRENNKL